MKPSLIYEAMKASLPYPYLEEACTWHLCKRVHIAVKIYIPLGTGHLPVGRRRWDTQVLNLYDSKGTLLNSITLNGSPCS